MKTHSFLNKLLVVIFVTVLAFVCVARPLQARADSGSMDYVETDLSTNDVKALFTGASAIVPAAIMIIGFIVMCYCVLRNVEVPLSFSSQTSFTDKLTQLGQYAIDNATDDIKNFLYSVYIYCNDNGITSILGLSKFVALQAGKFFGAITSWIGGSLIKDRTDVGDGLISNFVSSPLFFNLPLSTFDYSSFSTISSVSLGRLFGLCIEDESWRIYFSSLYFNSSIDYSNKVCVFKPDGFAIYDIVSGGFSLTSDRCIAHSSPIWFYTSNSSWSSSAASFDYSYFSSGNYIVSANEFWITNSNSLTYTFMPYLSLLSALPFAAFYNYSVTGSAPSSLSSADLSDISFVQDVLNPAVDNVYVPTDVWNIDIVGTWEQIARDVSATYDQTERIAAFVGDIPLTLTSAQSYAPTINDAGNYVFPDFGSVWKYPQYFFDTLSGWGMFVGNCLRAVTVDEGGLSWIFYGGFVLLVCGGIIGKILMG